jgi:site-specific DNA-methyltransferase (adenine-specific)
MTLTPYYDAEGITIYHGCSADILPHLSGLDACVTDPPYGLSFMGKAWDYDVPTAALWAACLAAIKPGAHLLAFAGTRTQHRMAVNIEDAGFDIRDMIAWVYGQGFPKSLNVGTATQDPRWNGWGTALKPALEPITLARKPFAGTVAQNVLEHGTGAINVDGCRVGGESHPVMVRTSTVVNATCVSGVSTGATASGEVTTLGRFPANLIHDGSEDVTSAFPFSKDGRYVGRNRDTEQTGGMFRLKPLTTDVFYGGAGSAARFFYCAKASKSDRGEGNTHPTVKPLALMRYLVRLVCRPGGVVLDPFMGSGTTLLAARLEGMRAVGIEREEKYCEIAARRLAGPGGASATIQQSNPTIEGGDDTW